MANPYRRGQREPVRLEPGNYPGLVAAWLADRGLTPDAAVPTWADQALNFGDATQGTGADQPVQSSSGWLPGLAAVTFDGASDHMDVTWTNEAPASLTVYLVIDQVNAATQQFALSFWDSTSGTGAGTQQLVCVARTGAGNLATFDGDEVFKDFAATVAGHQCLVWTFDADAGTTTVHREMVSLGSDTYTPPARWDRVVIGGWAADTGTQNLNGAVGAVLVYDGAHDDDTRAAVLSGIARQWPLPPNLYTVVTNGQSNIANEPQFGLPVPEYYTGAGVLTHNGTIFQLATTDDGATPPGIGVLAYGVATNLQPRKGPVCVIGRPQDGSSMLLNTVGSANWNTTKARVSAAGVTPSVLCIECGETDSINNTPKATYKTQLSDVVVDAETEWPGITVIIFQTASVAPGIYTAGDSLPIREAQQEVAAAASNRHLISVEHLNNLRQDNIHQPPIGQDLKAAAAVTLIA